MMTEDDDGRTVTVKDDERTEEQKGEGADGTRNVDMEAPVPDAAVVEEEEEEADPTVEEDTTRRVIFETDNWEDCITEAVWFGQKIPFKKRMGGSRHNKDQKCPVAAFFETQISL